MKKKGDDYVISSGVNYTVKQFINKVTKYLGLKIKWSGNDLNEKATDIISGKVIIKIKKELFRPIEIRSTFGNSKKAHKILRWHPKTDFNKLVKIMCDAELEKY